MNPSGQCRLVDILLLKQGVGFKIPLADLDLVRYLNLSRRAKEPAHTVAIEDELPNVE